LVSVGPEKGKRKAGGMEKNWCTRTVEEEMGDNEGTGRNECLIRLRRTRRSRGMYTRVIGVGSSHQRRKTTTTGGKKKGEETRERLKKEKLPRKMERKESTQGSQFRRENRLKKTTKGRGEQAKSNTAEKKRNGRENASYRRKYTSEEKQDDGGTKQNKTSTKDKGNKSDEG